MKRIIVDYAKLTNEILSLLVEKFPDGYDDADIIRFKNAKNETVEAVEVRTEDTIYLVKVSTKLADRIVNFDDEDDDIIIPVEPINVKDIDLEADSDEEEEEEKKDLPEFDDEDGDAENTSNNDFEDEDEDEDEE